MRFSNKRLTPIRDLKFEDPNQKRSHHIRIAHLIDNLSFWTDAWVIASGRLI